MAETVDRSVQDAFAQMQQANAQRYGVSSPDLIHGGGGGTYDGMDSVDAKIAASEARTDTKFAELRGDLKDFATGKELRNNVWGAAAAILGVLLALAAFGGDRFDAGLSLADKQQAQAARDRSQDTAVARIEKKIDSLIARTPTAGASTSR